MKQKKCCGAKSKRRVSHPQDLSANCEVFADEMFRTLSEEEAVLLKEGEAAFERSDFRSSAELYERLLALNPGLSGSWTRLGNAYEQLGEKQDAWEVQQRGHSLFPHDPVLLYNMGNLKLDRSVLLHNSGDSANSMETASEAIEYLSSSLKLDLNNASCHYNLALAYWMHRDQQNAKTSMQRALELNPALTLPPGWFFGPRMN